MSRIARVAGNKSPFVYTALIQNVPDKVHRLINPCSSTASGTVPLHHRKAVLYWYKIQTDRLRKIVMKLLESVPRFDMKKAPMRMHLRPLLWLLTKPTLLVHRHRLTKVKMDGLKPPYILLCNHNAFMDMSAAIWAVFPHRVNFIVAIDGFIGREWLLRLIGCICKRKFTNDIQLLRHIKTVLSRGDIIAVYPEARYSLCGTTAVLPDSVGKMAKLFKVPVVTLITHGHHVNSPFFNLPDHGVLGTEAVMTQLLSEEDLNKLSVSEINEKIREAFVYDDYAWQKERGIRITYKNRAKGLEKVLYQCPVCRTEFHMHGDGTLLKCSACNAQWYMTELGELEYQGAAKRVDTPDTQPALSEGFSHIPDWYEWERQNVREEVRQGVYSFSCSAVVKALPNARKFLDIGKADFSHDMAGFHLAGAYSGEEYRLDIPASELYSVHIEYEYLGKFGDCVDLNTLTDTLYVYPKDCLFSVTKIALATEELYRFYHGGSFSL